MPTARAPGPVRAVAEVTLATLLGAGIVSALQAHPRTASAVLLGLAGAHLVRRAVQSWSAAHLSRETFMMLTTGVIGYLTESWGTTHEHWTYAHLPPGHTVPLWVPVAWVLASQLLDRLDRSLLRPGLGAAGRLGLAYLCGVFFPWLGESICIANGVWSYHWPWKILGVPLLALVLISYAHVTFSLIRIGLFGAASHGAR